jgi:urea carboxylase
MRELTVALEPGQIEVVATMIASVWKVLVAAGDIVDNGFVLTILEAMKMEIPVCAPSKEGRFHVDAILKEPGDRVEVGEALVLLREIP